jgi:malate dehydrogenase (oxaloacetate-decarboxylating)(NADP+)
VALAAVVAKALTITDEDFIVAAKTLAELVRQEKLKDGCCYPDLSNIREVSQKIAAAVAKHIERFSSKKFQKHRTTVFLSSAEVKLDLTSGH